MSRKPTTRVLPCGPKGRVCVDVQARVLFFSKWTNYYYYYYRTYTIYTVVVGCVCALERKREWEKTSRFDTLAYVIVRDCGAGGGGGRGSKLLRKKNINKRSS